MEFKPKNREWVKNAAIAFLAVLLVLTFFSNTIMNRTLPEVATQYVESGPITAKVRGSGTVVANGSHQVKADQTRDIRAVMVKVGQEVEAGDVLFVLGAGASEELEQAQEALRTLQLNYQKAAINMVVPDFEFELENKAIKRANEALLAAQKSEADALAALNSDSGLIQGELDKAKSDLEAAQQAYNEVKDQADKENKKAKEEADLAAKELDEIVKLKPVEGTETITTSADESTKNQDTGSIPEASSSPTIPPQENKMTMEEWQKMFDAANVKSADANKKLNETETQNKLKVDAAKKNAERCQAIVDRLTQGEGPKKEAYDAAVKAREAAEDVLFNAEYALKQKKLDIEKSQQLASIDLSEIGYQIEQQKKKIKELSGGEDNEITAKVSGTIQTVDCTAGDTKVKDDLLCTIEVPDMGYTMSFSVTNDQARRLRPGDSATVSNFYWGNSITATLNTIKVDPKNPQTNKLLSFDLEGDVSAGSELTLSVGQKSANYDVIIPNSSIRNDTNGSFVLKIEAKNSPLGNRYIARRVSVEVLAADDVNSAVTGDLGYGDYVITTSNAPVKTGDQVRMADS